HDIRPLADGRHLSLALGGGLRRALDASGLGGVLLLECPLVVVVVLVDLVREAERHHGVAPGSHRSSPSLLLLSRCGPRGSTGSAWVPLDPERTAVLRERRGDPRRVAGVRASTR